MQIVEDSRALSHPKYIKLIFHSFILFMELSLMNIYYILETSDKKTSTFKELMVQWGVFRHRNNNTSSENRDMYQVLQKYRTGATV